ncbi:hypothetical protein LK540_17225 [Massilia sp. IC2-278]|uniref:hypothetical protein n=1 Tax=Massilia sp. IC2-278 TaxID=2887200 RepID=UPI001E58DC9A|nr:hypothetical protein [Massilia sp. IC2-278]MCC2962171.1 hypothetical protein [Massilia sp. IC2-278]
MSRLETFLMSVIGLVGLLTVAVIGVRWYGDMQYHAGRTDAVEERAAADAFAVLRRTEENVVLAQSQGAAYLKITETKNEELAPVRERIVTQRVYVGSAICGPAPTTEDAGADSGDETNPARRLVREDAERDIRALKVEVEEHLATGRACQAVLREYGLAP